jgi:Fur family transcriptional regulator, ferric uptake regulator
MPLMGPGPTAQHTHEVDDVVEVHRTAAERLQGVDQRYTAGRRAIVDALVESPRPLTIAELLESAPSLPQSSAYRNLAVLEQADVVHRVFGSDEFARFELTEDLAGHHHHLICSICGDVADFTVDPAIEALLVDAMQAVTDDTGFRPLHHRLDLVGVCAACS